MPSRLIETGKVQILGQTLNNVVYAVANDSSTGLAKDSPTVLKRGTVWCEGRETLGPNKERAVSDKTPRKEASIYQTLGHHDHILRYHGIEISVLDGHSPEPKNLGVAPGAGSLR